MTATPLVADLGTVRLEVLVDGTPSNDAYPVLDVEVEREVNRIPMARLVLLDGDLSEQTFAGSESDDFTPGATIVVRAGYGNASQDIFSGVIASHGVRINADGSTALVLTCADAANAMTMARSSAVYAQQTDSAIMQTLIADAGLDADVTSTSETFEQLVRDEASPWDFLVSRAEANGMVVLVEDGIVRVQKPTFSAPVLTLTAGSSITEFDAEVDARAQLTGITASAWDPATQAAITADAAEPSTNDQGNLTGATLASSFPAPVDQLFARSAITQGALQTWANATLQRQRLARIRGSVRCPGTALVLPGTTVSIEGISARVNGDAYVTRVTHRIEAGHWGTQIGFGLEPLSHTARHRDVEGPGAAGLLPPARGLHVATVNKIDADPAGQRRVRVTLPLVTDGGEGIWARFAAPYATKTAGAVFLPEIGDEVVIGFLGDDPANAVVLGALHSSSRTAPFDPDAKNTWKGIVTNSQLRLTFDDDKKVIELKTPGGHVCTLDDDAKTITITDSNGSTLKMSSSGVSLTSPKDISLTAQGGVKIDGTTGVTITSSGGDVKGSGVNVSFDGQMSFAAQGAASAKLTASGQVTVQGAMVMIN